MAEQAEHLEEIRAELAATSIADPDGEARLILRAAAEGADPVAAARALAERRAAGEPLAALLGQVSFLGVELVVAPGVITPRVETEILGRAAISALGEMPVPSGESPPQRRVIDMCCGAGNLACAIASQVETAQVWAADLTEGCVALTQRNIDQLGLGGRVAAHCGDLFEPLHTMELEGSIDLIVCNPPYISSGRLDEERAALWEHEPREAFDGGPYGLSVHQQVIRTALTYLRPGGFLMFEIGLGQERQVKLLFMRARGYEDVRWETDAEGNPRVAIARKKAE